ncbi:hypothetical protein GCM10027062_39330 [Nocardioides hungaricus]
MTVTNRPKLAMTGVDHFAVTVSDLDASETFYTKVLGLMTMFDFDTTRLLINRHNAFTVALTQHEGQDNAAFTHARIGVDHLGFPVDTLEELEVWERHLADLGVEFTPIRHMEFGHHLNFRDPDNIALELSAPNQLMLDARAFLAAGADVADADIRAAARELFGMGDVIPDR